MIFNNMNRIVGVFIVFGLLVSCSGNKKEQLKDVEKPVKVVLVPTFNSDSAFSFIQKQVDFGPRIPNSNAHKLTGNYLVETLKMYGATVHQQEFEATTFEGKKLKLKNIIGSFFPDKPKRVLLAAHWDTRPFADKDKENPNALFDGANDGASGVGVLLEIARLLKNQSTDIGIDIIFFDGEDGGERNDATHRIEPPSGLDDWWCLGSQYWSKNKHNPRYAAYYGILLDMVGAKNAQFHREEMSLRFAPSIVEKVWNTAAKIGYSHVFVKSNKPGITDDHIFVNKYAKIPMIDIVHYDPEYGYFGSFHHSTEDNMELISKETLKAVGETLANVIYYEE